MLVTIPGDMNIAEEELEQLTDKDIKNIIKAAYRLEKNIMQGDVITQEQKRMKMEKEAKKDTRLQLKLKVLEMNIIDVDTFKQAFEIQGAEQKSIKHSKPEKAEKVTIADLVPTNIRGSTDPDDDDDDEPEPTPKPHPLPPVPEVVTKMKLAPTEKPKEPMTVKEMEKAVFLEPPKSISPRVQRLWDLIEFYGTMKMDEQGRPVVKVKWQSEKAYFDKYRVNYDDRFEDFMKNEVHDRSKSEPIYIPMTLTDVININGRRELLAEPHVTEIIEKRKYWEENAFVIETITMTKKILLMTDEEKHARKRITADDSFMLMLAKKQERHGIWKVAPVKVYDDRIHVVPVEQMESFDEAKEAERRLRWFGSKKKVVDLAVRIIKGCPRIMSDDIDTLDWEIRDGWFFKEKMKTEDVQGIWKAQISGADHRRHITFVQPIYKEKETEEEIDYREKQLNKLQQGDRIEVI